MSLHEAVGAELDDQESCGWHHDWPEALAALRAVLELHRPSRLPRASGPSRGRHFCVACSTSVDEHRVNVLAPCPTVAAMAQALGVTP